MTMGNYRFQDLNSAGLCTGGVGGTRFMPITTTKTDIDLTLTAQV
jgi:hypothetical protein